MDFNNILDQESHFIASLTNMVQGTSAATTSATSNLNTVDSALSSLSSKFDTPGSQDILTRQADMQRIIDAENGRLTTKQGSIDQALQSQNRLIDLNQSYSEKYNQYIFIVIIFVVALALFLGITVIQQTMTNPPTDMLQLLSVAIIGGAFIYAIIIYMGIQARSNMNYAELAVATPQPLTDAQKTARNKANVESGKLLASQNSGCVGSECCDTTTTKWDQDKQTCVKDPFTTIADSNAMIIGKNSVSKNSVGKNSVSKNSLDTKAYSDNEFDVYALYK